jgi:hypothetical protein
MNPLPADYTANLVIWAIVWAALIGWQVVTARAPRLDSFSALVVLARRTLASRWLLVAGWAWLGWHLFVRTSY